MVIKLDRCQSLFKHNHRFIYHDGITRTNYTCDQRCSLLLQYRQSQTSQQEGRGSYSVTKEAVINTGDDQRILPGELKTLLRNGRGESEK